MNITGKYLKVWKVKKENGFTKLDLGDSQKQKDGTYMNYTWFDCALMGKAKEFEVKEKDVIEIKSGLISQRKYKDKYYNNIIIFEAEIMKAAEKTEAPQENNEPNLPF